jgi:hypothetical protein
MLDDKNKRQTEPAKREVMIKRSWDAVDGYKTEIVTIGEPKNKNYVRSSARLSVGTNVRASLRNGYRDSVVVNNKHDRHNVRPIVKHESSSYYYSDTESSYGSYTEESSSSMYINVVDKVKESNDILNKGL